MAGQLQRPHGERRFQPREGGKASPHTMALVDPTQQLLEAAMRGSWQRETALTNNIANADTPGYQRQEVNFESTLQSAMNAGSSPEQIEFQTETSPTDAGPNGDTVSIDENRPSSPKTGSTTRLSPRCSTPATAS